MFKSPGNEFLSHMQRKIREYIFTNCKKNYQEQIITVGAIGKFRKKLKKIILKICICMANEFLFINIIYYKNI